jgi:hypothetical protein
MASNGTMKKSPATLRTDLWHLTYEQNAGSTNDRRLKIVQNKTASSGFRIKHTTGVQNPTALFNVTGM